jgi:hypothetical protein
VCDNFLYRFNGSNIWLRESCGLPGDRMRLDGHAEASAAAA